MNTTETPRTDACPHCGCQTKDPFGFSMTIHEVDLCKARKINQEMNIATDTNEVSPTPRTDAVFSEPCAPHQVIQKWEKIIEHSRQLERELAEARQWLNERYKHLSEADERAERAEAEVERLRATLRRAAEIAEDSTESLMDWDENRRSETQRKNYAELEATLNQDNK